MSIYNLTNFDNPNITLNCNIRNPYFCQLVKNTETTINSYTPAFLSGFSSENPGGFDNVLNNMALNESSAIVIPKAGTYRISCQLYGDGYSIGTDVLLYKNSTIISNGCFAKQPNNASGIEIAFSSASINICINLEVGDKLYLYAYGDLSEIGGADISRYCYFSAEYLGF